MCAYNTLPLVRNAELEKSARPRTLLYGWAGPSESHSCSESAPESEAESRGGWEALSRVDAASRGEMHTSRRESQGVAASSRDSEGESPSGSGEALRKPTLLRLGPGVGATVVIWGQLGVDSDRRARPCLSEPTECLYGITLSYE